MQDLQNQVNAFYSINSESLSEARVFQEIDSRVLRSNRDIIKGLALTMPDIDHNTSILDIGCGTGVDTVVLLRLAGFNAFGIDLSLNRIKLGQVVASKIGVDPSCLSVQTVQDIDEKYDVIVGNDIIHHFVDYQSFLVHTFDLLKPGGKCLFLEPTIFPFRFLKGKYKDGEFYQKSDCIEIHINPFKLIKAFKSVNFKNVKSFANCYHPKITKLAMKLPISKYFWYAMFIYAEK